MIQTILGYDKNVNYSGLFIWEGLFSGVLFALLMVTYIYITYKSSKGDLLERPLSREFNSSWISSLSNLIMKNCQTKEKNGVYEYYIWKNNGFVLTLYLSWQDFYDGLDASDLPVLMSFDLTIYKDGIIKREVFQVYSDKNGKNFDDKYYFTNYDKRMSEQPMIRIGGKDIGGI